MAGSCDAIGRAPPPAPQMGRYQLRLYVSGRTPQGERAERNLSVIWDGELEGRCDVPIVNLIEHPAAADAERVIATPILIKVSPLPVRRIIGDLSDRGRVLAALGVPESTRVAPMTLPVEGD